MNNSCLMACVIMYASVTLPYPCVGKTLVGTEDPQVNEVTQVVLQFSFTYVRQQGKKCIHFSSFSIEII